MYYLTGKSTTSERTVTSKDDELIVVCDFVYANVGESGDYLRLWGQIRALLELKVADCSGKGEVAIDTAKVDEATSCTYTSFLGC